MSDKLKSPSSANNATSDEDAWIQSTLQTHLDTKVKNLDFTVTSKLSAARHRALSEEKNQNTRAGFRHWPTLISATVVFAMALFLGTQLFQQPQALIPGPVSTLSQSDLMEDLNLLSASDDIEFYQSMEFLEWMESNSG